MLIDEKLILKLERLSKLQLTGEERQGMQKDLNNILGMVEKLQEVNTDNVEPLVYITEQVSEKRKDIVKNQLDTVDALKNAPKSDEQFFKVPKMIDK